MYRLIISYYDLRKTEKYTKRIYISLGVAEDNECLKIEKSDVIRYDKLIEHLFDTAEQAEQFAYANTSLARKKKFVDEVTFRIIDCSTKKVYKNIKPCLSL